MTEGNDKPSLEDLDAKLSTLKTQRDQDAAKRKAKAEASKKSGLGTAYKIGSELVAAMIVGVAIGYGLDYLFGTSPAMLIVFILFGFAAGILNVFRAAGVVSPRTGLGSGAGELDNGSKPDREDPDR